MVSALGRWLRHLTTGAPAVRRVLPPDALDAIERAIQAAESRHPGEIRFAVEPALPPAALARGLSARDRAIQVFGELRVWDTEHNNGVLVYLLLADRDVEIVADRGVAGGRVAQSEWDACCRAIEEPLRAGRFREGVIAGVEAVAALLARHPPAAPDAGNELPDRPALL